MCAIHRVMTGRASVSLCRRPCRPNEKSPLPGGGGSGLDFRMWRGRRCTPFSVGIASGRSRWPTTRTYELPNDSATKKLA
ncbi:hypothetical protein EOB77_19250 [Mesorhizobium sp. M7A.F.Ca.MR.228.00.0.0]|nr:hypothetical protein EOB80_15180 [Mesorhizobium sp. M7A.F.Ca.MR.245.00.0.0]RUV49512.1 hypothetical protein EOB77_19250 [Mesorhizobium sp. M7A.F.Ca.MR.228.00.0.0]